MKNVYVVSYQPDVTASKTVKQLTKALLDESRLSLSNAIAFARVDAKNHIDVIRHLIETVEKGRTVIIIGSDEPE